MLVGYCTFHRFTLSAQLEPHPLPLPVHTTDIRQEPTQFWLDTLGITEVFNSPELIQDLAAFADERQVLGDIAYINNDYLDEVTGSQSILFLRLSAAADFYSTNATLMKHPPPVNVDIILDPYLFNVLPRSLLPTAGYILVLAIVGWYVSGAIWKWLLSVSEPKPHVD